MPSRIKFWLVFLAIALLLLGISGCARKRRAPLPAPAPAPTASGTVPPRVAGSPSELSTTMMPPPGCLPGPRAPWLECRYTSPSGELLRYYLALPSAPGTGLLPMVTVLHGSSGSGPGNGAALNGGNHLATDLWVSEDVQRSHPSIVVVPQAEPAPGETWVRAWRAPAKDDPRPKEALVLVMELLAALEDRYPVDRHRLYLTGQSMGGFGAWLAYTRYPGRFAAIVPVCGGGDPGAVVPNLTAVWAFHGDQDAVVPVARARAMVAAIEASGSPVRYLEYPGLGHNIFAKAYGEADLVEWLYSQRLQE